jgi:hypothetical protein
MPRPDVSDVARREERNRGRVGEYINLKWHIIAK